MKSNVYRIDYNPDQVPSDPDLIPAFARDQVVNLVGPGTTGIDFSMEAMDNSEYFRLTLTVPQRMDSITARLHAAGFSPSHTEPEVPVAYEDENFCTLPRAFQVLHFGQPVHPQAVQDSPYAMATIANALAEYGVDMPAEALNYHGWLTINSDEDTDILTITW